ncbi:secreted acidic protein 2-like [Octopus bimaculoides]|uniref:secreted acidic protein 2-like n=1 Tax=Octopus bimaculoides TaxID=37653 RepID=UPI00071CE8D3|nr:secreted acidic protein 2-like [Octopus bimaculoides]|eukprot:XP_014767530.1 PREDICTED: secreted acidic protein 2-like [Octopus bimaculoides]
MLQRQELYGRLSKAMPDFIVDDWHEVADEDYKDDDDDDDDADADEHAKRGYDNDDKDSDNDEKMIIMKMWMMMMMGEEDDDDQDDILGDDGDDNEIIYDNLRFRKVCEIRTKKAFRSPKRNCLMYQRLFDL